MAAARAAARRMTEETHTLGTPAPGVWVVADSTTRAWAIRKMLERDEEKWEGMIHVGTPAQLGGFDRACGCADIPLDARVFMIDGVREQYLQAMGFATELS